MSACPVCRKQLYRPNLIKKFPALRLLDAKDVTLEERERTEVKSAIPKTAAHHSYFCDRLWPDLGSLSLAMVCATLNSLSAAVSVQLLFSSEPRNSPTFATDAKYVLSTKVPIKLTSMNFEALTVRQPAVDPVQMMMPGGGPMMPNQDGRQLPADWQQQYQSEPRVALCSEKTGLANACCVFVTGRCRCCRRSGGVCPQHARAAQFRSRSERRRSLGGCPRRGAGPTCQ